VPGCLPDCRLAASAGSTANKTFQPSLVTRNGQANHAQTRQLCLAQLHHMLKDSTLHLDGVRANSAKKHTHTHTEHETWRMSASRHARITGSRRGAAALAFAGQRDDAECASAEDWGGRDDAAMAHQSCRGHGPDPDALAPRLQQDPRPARSGKRRGGR
jgi:hypothetical protein